MLPKAIPLATQELSCQKLSFRNQIFVAISKVIDVDNNFRRQKIVLPKVLDFYLSPIIFFAIETFLKLHFFHQTYNLIIQNNIANLSYNHK